MRLSDKMTQTHHNLDEAYEGLGEQITTAFNQMFSYGEEAERERIIKLAKNRICFDHAKGCDHADCYALSFLIAAIKGEEE